MTEEHSIEEARRNLPRLVRGAELGKTVCLTRRGRPVAFLVGHRLYEKAMADQPDFPEAWEEFRKKNDLSELDVDEFLEGIRDATSRPDR